MDVRPAAPEDLPQCQAIYAHHVLHGTGSFEEAPPALATIIDRHGNVIAAGRPWLVATDMTGLLGFGYYAPFRDRAAYRFTMEDSLYVHEQARGRGVGKALLAALLRTAEAQGVREMLALIGDSANTSSIGVHAALGFSQVGVMRRVGYKFDRWLDVITMQKSLSSGQTHNSKTSYRHSQNL